MAPPREMIATMRMPVTIPAMQAAAEGLTRLNVAIMRAAKKNGVPFAPLLLSGVRYKQEPHGFEMWDNCAVVLTRGWGDCEDLAAWRAAELRLQGDRGAHVAVRPSRSGIPGHYHAVVRTGSGKLEDPSRWLGMA